MKKSLATHNEIRKSRNFQRGNTDIQRGIASGLSSPRDINIQRSIVSVLTELPQVIKDNYANLKKIGGYKRGIQKRKNNFFDMYVHKLDQNWEENRIKLIVNWNAWTNSLRIDPQWANKENHYYLVETISNEGVKNQIEYAINFLKNWTLHPQSLFKKIELIDPNTFDLGDYMSDDFIESTWLSQQTYNKIRDEEWKEEAVKYGKWLRGEKK